MNYHIMIDDKFINGFINDAENVTTKNTNRYFIRGVKQNAIYVIHPKAEWVEDIWSNDFKSILNSITDQDKIFIHWYDLYVGRLMLTIDKNIPLYVIPWGGDFYEDPYLYHINWIHDPITLRYVKKAYIFFEKWAMHPKSLLKNLWRLYDIDKKNLKRFELKKLTVHRINYLLIQNNSIEFDLIRNIYQIPEISCLPFFYDQNFDLANKLRIVQVKSNINIQIGNSATSANNHVDCFKILRSFNNENIKLILPLSYGESGYGEFVKRNCLKIFRNKCEFLERFMPREEYIVKLNEIDVAIMFHNRSQAFGNCISLLTLGKKLYLKSNNPLYQVFQMGGIIVFDANKIKDLTFEEFIKPLKEDQIQSNIEKISNFYSEKTRLKNLRILLN
jgi:dTDP-N-acetylfucosamine:lipid II N-acetylfucosaminyltransferase